MADFSTITIMFTTHAANGNPIAPSSGFEAADVNIYKDGSATQKTTTNGLTMTSPFDSITGLHCLAIDTTNTTGDSGFWADGSTYTVVLVPDETVDGVTVVKVLDTFRLGATPTANTIANAVHNKVVDSSYTFIESIRLQNSVLFGKATVSGNAIAFRDLADSKDRVALTADIAGNRTLVTLDGS